MPRLGIELELRWLVEKADSRAVKVETQWVGVLSTCFTVLITGIHRFKPGIRVGVSGLSLRLTRSFLSFIVVGRNVEPLAKFIAHMLILKALVNGGNVKGVADRQEWTHTHTQGARHTRTWETHHLDLRHIWCQSMVFFFGVLGRCVVHPRVTELTSHKLNW